MMSLELPWGANEGGGSYSGPPFGGATVHWVCPSTFTVHTEDTRQTVFLWPRLGSVRFGSARFGSARLGKAASFQPKG